MRGGGLGMIAAMLLAAAGARAEPPPLAAYGRLPATERVSLSPSGSAYALIGVVGDERRLVVMSSGGAALFVGTVGKVKPRDLTWAGDDFLVLQHSAAVALGEGFTTETAELDGALVVDIKAGKVRPVFGADQHAVANTVEGFYGAAQRQGRWVGYFAAIPYVDIHRDGSGGDLQAQDGVLYPDLYAVDLATGRFAHVANGRPDLKQWVLTPTGEIAARTLYDERGQGWRVEREPSGATLVRGKAATGWPQVLGFGRTCGALLLSGSAYAPAQAASLDGGTATEVAELPAGTAPLFDSVTGLWIGVTDGTGRTASFFDARRQAQLRGAFKAFPTVTPHLVSYDAALDHLVVFTDGGDDSGTYWLVDVAKGRADEIGAAYPQVGPRDTGPVRSVDYRAADGLPMNGVLTLPPDRPAHALPLVVMPHGGPESHDDPGFDWWAQAFAGRGYAVWQPNFRGSSGFGAAFRDAGFGQWGRKMQTDISDGVAELARQGLVDPHRACIVGASYGGYAALAGVTLQQGLYRCAVAVGGVSDPGGMLRDDTEREGGSTNATMRYWRLYLGGPQGRLGDLATVSPLRQAAHADAPVLLIHGRDDTVVLPGQSEAMARALRAAGKPAEQLSIPGADHWLLEEDARLRTLEASVAFVLRHDPPDPAPSAKPG